MGKNSVIIALLLILIIISSALFFYFLYLPQNNNTDVGQTLENPIGNPNLITINTITNITTVIIDINETHLAYVLDQIGAYKLHNPAFSSDTPRIQIELNNKVFKAEVISQKCNVKRGESQNPDIIIRTTDEEITNSLWSTNTRNYIKMSVQDGKTTLELKASQVKLLSKGYLGLYEEMTGKSYTGSTIRKL